MDVTVINLVSAKESTKAVKALKDLGVTVVAHTKPNKRFGGIVEHVLTLAAKDDWVLLPKHPDELTADELEKMGDVCAQLEKSTNTVMHKLSGVDLSEMKDSVVKSDWNIELKDLLDGV